MRTVVGASPSSVMGPPALLPDLRASKDTSAAALPTAVSCTRRHPMPDTLTHLTEHKTFSEPEEVREFPHGRAEILSFAGGEVGRLVFEPGWRWSNDVKPIAGTDSCLAPHVQFHVSVRPRTPSRRP